MILSNLLKGTGVALITPFAKDRSIDYKALKKLIDFVINGGVDYLVVLGTTGESVTISSSEKQILLAKAIEIVNKRVPIVLGLGGNNTQEIVSSLRKSSDFSDVFAILSVSPYYNKPNQRGIYEHYKAIVEESPKPIILYNVPGRTNSNITSETTLKLAEDFKKIIGIKEASGNLEQCMRIIKHKPKNFLVISGDDNLTLPMIACGADGVISVVANAFPKDFSQLVRNILSGNVKEARRIHYKLNEITEQLFIDGNPAGIKAVLEIMNICQNNLRLPLVNVTNTTYNNLKRMLSLYK